MIYVGNPACLPTFLETNERLTYITPKKAIRENKVKYPKIYSPPNFEPVIEGGANDHGCPLQLRPLSGGEVEEIRGGPTEVDQGEDGVSPLQVRHVLPPLPPTQHKEETLSWAGKEQPVG